MSMTCNFLLTIGKVTPEVFFKACLLRAKKGIGDAHQTDVMIPAKPMTPLVMVQSQFFLQFTVIQLHAPASPGDAHQAPQSRTLRAQPSQPVFRGLFGFLRPFHQEPLRHPRWVFLLAPTVSRPNGEQGEARALRSSASLTPGHGTPSGGRQLLRQRSQVL